MTLTATKPEVKEKRLKMFVFGEAGIGKTVAALQFPQSYIIDTEKGTDFYSDLVIENGSVVLQTINPDDIKEQLRSLLTEKHNYKTLIIDPITQVYNAVQEKWTRVFEKYAETEKAKEVQDFGMRYWGKVKGEFKAIQRLMMQLDMNVIITAHQKDVYGTGFNKIGVTFDSMKGDDYLFDLVFQIFRRGNDRVARTIKERALPDKQKFPEEFIWSYDNFLKFYGKEVIEREAAPVNMATEEQVLLITKYLDILKIEDAEVEKWFLKADVSEWAEMSQEQIQNCIKYCEKKLKVAGLMSDAVEISTEAHKEIKKGKK